MKIKELRLEGGVLRVEFDVGDGTTITHRTSGTRDGTPWDVYNALFEAEKIATRMVEERKTPAQLPKLPGVLREMLDTKDSVYDDPGYFTSPGPIDHPPRPLDAGD